MHGSILVLTRAQPWQDSAVTKIQASLAQRVTAMKVDRPEDPIPVIVTVRPGTGTAGMESKGLNVERSLESVSAVAGTVAAGDIEDLATLEEVRAIEYDGEIRTL